MAPRRGKLLSSTRLAHAKAPPTLSSRAARATIRAYHTRRKQLNQAEVNSQTARDAAHNRLQADLPAYQRASLQGQSLRRGGDTSRVLVQWLRPILQPDLRGQVSVREHPRPRLLDIGALRGDNACTRLFDVESIDLNPLDPSIKREDLMARPVPQLGGDLKRTGFDVISLSLVLNFVPDPAARGAMLRRAAEFLRSGESGGRTQGVQQVFPGLFVVLPAPCIQNSRYLDEERLQALMGSLGFTCLFEKATVKLAYYYFRYEHPSKPPHIAFPKKVLRSGGTRNNFAIVLQNDNG